MLVTLESIGIKKKMHKYFLPSHWSHEQKQWNHGSKAMDHLNAMQIKIEDYCNKVQIKIEDCHNKVQEYHLKYLKHQYTKNTKNKWKYYGEHSL
jgi:hypothetical protein